MLLLHCFVTILRVTSQREPREAQTGLTVSVSSLYKYGKDLSDVAFNETGNGVIATFSDSTIIGASILLGADGPRSKVREFAMLGTDKASLKSFPIWHHNMTVCYDDADKARYLRQQFPTSYLALSQRSFHAFQSSEFSQF